MILVCVCTDELNIIPSRSVVAASPALAPQMNVIVPHKDWNTNSCHDNPENEERVLELHRHMTMT